MKHNHLRLDDINFKIMSELCKDGRTSSAKIANKLGINASTVNKRTRAMIKEGIFTIKAVPNQLKLGFKVGALIGLSIDPSLTDAIYNHLISIPYIPLIATCTGRFDILLLINHREWEDLHIFIRKEFAKINGIRHIETFFMSGKEWLNKAHDGSNIQEIVIDEIDKKLIYKLMHDGRENYAELAEELGVSISSISKRIDFLIKQDIIRILAVPDHTKLGFTIEAFVAVQCEFDKISSICTQLRNLPEVNIVITLLKGYDILFTIHAFNPDSLYEFMKNNIQTIDGILQTETFIQGGYSYFKLDKLFLLQ